ncbi:MAG: hypothetical protein HY801_15595 [Candidatus Lindowbacteria bacterium]|nr:hypothetical protein [Candidatus Lindowbacteria bacterium]
MRKPLRNREGFTLFEILTYIFLFGLLTSVIYSVYFQFSRTLPAAEGALLRERGAYHAVQRIQDDIRRSSGIEENFGPLKSGPGCLMLRIRREGGSGNDIVVYKFAKTQKALIRYQVAAEQSSQNVYSLKLGYDVEDFKFSVDEDNANLLKTNLRVKRGTYGILRNRPLTFYTLMRN